MIRSKPMIENVPDPSVKRWTIPLSNFVAALKQAIACNDKQQEKHLLNDFWICDEFAILKNDIQGEVQ